MSVRARIEVWGGWGTDGNGAARASARGDFAAGIGCDHARQSSFRGRSEREGARAARSDRSRRGTLATARSPGKKARKGTISRSAVQLENSARVSPLRVRRRGRLEYRLVDERHLLGPGRFEGILPEDLVELVVLLAAPGAEVTPHVSRSEGRDPTSNFARCCSASAISPRCRERTGGTRLTRRAAGRRAVNDAPERSPARNLERSEPYGSFRRATRCSGSDRRVLSRAQWPGERGACRICRILTSDPRGNRVTIGAAPGARAGSRAAVGRPRFR